MSLVDITGHLSTLFADGYETTARIISYGIYTLVLHPKIQEKLKDEVLSIGQDITVEAVSKLPYMEMFVSEIFRTLPLFPYIGRTCTENCKLGDLEVQKGQSVIIPVCSLHMDTNYYQNPNEFNPENFSEENKENRPKGTFFSFGGGPRMCLGVRYATANIKLILSYLLRDYDIIPSKNHPAKAVEPNLISTVVYLPKDPMYVTFKKTKQVLNAE